ncbi:SRPBCC family protein [Pseudonocardia endophytica]|uniref:Polyketide cyclase/dehydrase/lipid transport protein n=1 Tax=Pseudonocardia endophytica TaxID=401976 RepID=A0A4R1HSS8_PSEEN|nr:SRPBCC family protein [Pseudonocardia endophytica]TCK20452.1 polyketide cyclase/dehydrase/lipid transport protein [Pseudonocardia endophytica]
MDQASVRVAASPERVWALVTDITRMGEWSPEATGGRWRDGSGPRLGARFVGNNRHGPIRWNTHCRVTECEPPSRFTFTVAENRMAWGWLLAPDGSGGTELTQWREHLGPTPFLANLLVISGLIGRDREHAMVDGMHRTLEAVRTTAERAT